MLLVPRREMAGSQGAGYINWACTAGLPEYPICPVGITVATISLKGRVSRCCGFLSPQGIFGKRPAVLGLVSTLVAFAPEHWEEMGVRSPRSRDV